MDYIEVKNTSSSRECEENNTEEYKKIQEDMELVNELMNEINSLIQNQGENVSHIEENISQTSGNIQEAQVQIETAAVHNSDSHMINTYLYSAGTSAITGIVGVTFGFKPAIITAVVTGACYIAYKGVKWIGFN